MAVKWHFWEVSESKSDKYNYIHICRLCGQTQNVQPSRPQQQEQKRRNKIELCKIMRHAKQNNLNLDLDIPRALLHVPCLQQP